MKKELLHGKAYIFDQLVVVGSSNFISSGLAHNTGSVFTIGETRKFLKGLDGIFL